MWKKKRVGVVVWISVADRMRVIRTLDILVSEPPSELGCGRAHNNGPSRYIKRYDQLRVPHQSFLSLPFPRSLSSSWAVLKPLLTFQPSILLHPFTFTRSTRNVWPFQDRPARHCPLHCTGCTHAHQAYRSSHHCCYPEVGGCLCA